MTTDICIPLDVFRVLFCFSDFSIRCKCICIMISIFVLCDTDTTSKRAPNTHTHTHPNVRVDGRKRHNIKWTFCLQHMADVIHNNILLDWRDLNRNDYPLRGRRSFDVCVLSVFGRWLRAAHTIPNFLCITFNSMHFCHEHQVDNSIAINTHNALASEREIATKPRMHSIVHKTHKFTPT